MTDKDHSLRSKILKLDETIKYKHEMELVYLTINMLKEKRIIDSYDYKKLFKKIKKWENTFGNNTKAELKKTIIKIKELKNILKRNRTKTRSTTQSELKTFSKKATNLQNKIIEYKKKKLKES